MEYYIFLIGLVVGSFINVVVYRLPKGRTFISGRSSCTNCLKQIEWYDLIPVVSFFALKARCRNCKTAISWQYPLAELYSGAMFLFSFQIFSENLVYWLFSLFLIEIFLILALIDWQNLILPDSVILAAIAVTLIFGVYQRFWDNAPSGGVIGNILSRGNVSAALLFFAVIFLIWFLSKGEWIGLGDAKLVGVIGLAFGMLGATFIIYGAVFLGMIAGLIILMAKKGDMKTKLPFGTFLSVSATIYIFFGHEIISWSENVLLLIKNIPI
ncbi:MAG: prepilin peptidase [Candidatus Paceibacterota bacterium]